MPEIPEVTAFGAYIKKNCLHKTIGDIEAECPQLIKKVSFAAFKKIITGDQFKSVERLGKYLVISLQKSSKKVVMHFGLTGFLVYLKKHENVRFSCVVFIFKDRSELHWNSVRKFEKIWLVDSLDEIDGIKKLGPDPLTLTEKKFDVLIADNAKKKCKQFFMDQKIIAGIGNEYSDEILFQAGIDPRRKLGDLSVVEQKKLFQKMKAVLDYAIKLRLKNLRSVSAGGFFSKAEIETFKSSYLQAHRHGDGRCPKNKNHVLSHIKIGGRTTYFCPIDQK